MTDAHSRRPAFAALLLSGLSVGGCAHGEARPTTGPSDAFATVVPAHIVMEPPAPVQVLAIPELLPLPGQLKVIGDPARANTTERVGPIARVTAATRLHACSRRTTAI